MQACQAEEGCVYDSGGCHVATHGRLRLNGTVQNGTSLMQTLSDGTIVGPTLACFDCAVGRYTAGPAEECSSFEAEHRPFLFV